MEQALFEFKPFSQKQRMIFSWWVDGSPVKDYDGIIADGAIRSGKTVAMSLSYVMWAMENFNAKNFGMAGKTIQSFERNVLSVLKTMLTSRGYTYDHKRSQNLLVVRRGEVENYFYIFGGKDESSQDLIQGITLAGIFFDEIALMPQSFVNQATARCSENGSKFWLNCNPAGPFHYVKKEFIDKAKEKRLIYLHFDMDDNLSLSEQIKERYRNQYSGVFYQRYILGQWVVAEGIIYDMFDKDYHVVDIKKIEKDYEVKRQRFFTGSSFVSCDYGTQNATVFLLWKKGIDKKYYVVKEYYYSGRDNNKQKTDKEYVDDLIKWLGDETIREIIVDPSAASFITALTKQGFKVVKAKNDVIEGIREVSTALKDSQLFIDKSCANGIKEFHTYAWDEKAMERGEDKPIKDNDHFLDALRYGWMHTKNKVRTFRRPKFM